MPQNSFWHLSMSMHRILSTEIWRWVASSSVTVLASLLSSPVQPSNILLDEEGHLRLSDLGLACDFSDRQPSSSVWVPYLDTCGLTFDPSMIAVVPTVTWPLRWWGRVSSTHSQQTGSPSGVCFSSCWKGKLINLASREMTPHFSTLGF